MEFGNVSGRMFIRRTDNPGRPRSIRPEFIMTLSSSVPVLDEERQIGTGGLDLTSPGELLTHETKSGYVRVATGGEIFGDPFARHVHLTSE
jgi:hypothetical protein